MDRHFEQLRPVLLLDATNLEQVTKQIKTTAFVGNPEDDEESNKQNIGALLWPHVMSSHLSAHFHEYHSLKKQLELDIETQNREFREAVLKVKQLLAGKDLRGNWSQIVAISFVENALRRSRGVTLTSSNSGFSFTAWGGSLGGSGQPSPDQIAAFRAFNSIVPTQELQTRTEHLRARAEALEKMSQDLSKKARLLAEDTTLRGDCEFTRIDN